MRLMVAMSGGVDSSVAAAMCLADGHEVVGVTLKLWGGSSDSGCCAVSDVDDAKRVAFRLGIDHYVFNFEEAFDRHVVGPYVAAHRRGWTPNPCVECNRHVKFDMLLERASALGFDAVVTGHHVRRVVGDDDRYHLARAVDAAKDQSYVLYMLTQAELERCRFPIGERTKTEVRALAAEIGLDTAAKPDSQDVCFITRREGRAAFLGERAELRPAVVVDMAGRRVGDVEAIEMVTIGQRRGLGTAGGGAPRFAIDVDTARKVVTVGDRSDLDVVSTELESVVWSASPVVGPLAAQCSAHGSAAPCEVTVSADGRVVIAWDSPHRRIAPGQSVVLYRADEVVGGGIALPSRSTTS